MNIYVVGLICFIIGYMSHRTFASFMKFGRTMILCKQMIFDCLYICLIMTEDVAFVRSLKIKEMRDLGVTEKTISHSLSVFDRTMNDWKETCVRKILTSYPNIAKGTLKFHDWDSAIKHLQENR